MIPEFDEHGNLPVGIHNATLEEVIVRYGGPSPLRKQLIVPLRDFYSLVQPVAVEVFLVGSFITAKPGPGDVDFYTIMPDDWVQEHRRVAEEVFELQRRRARRHTLVHCTLCYVSNRACVEKHHHFFSHTKGEERPKGMIRLIGGAHDQE